MTAPPNTDPKGADTAPGGTSRWRFRILVPAEAFADAPDGLDALLASASAQDHPAWHLRLMGPVPPELDAVARAWIARDARITLEPAPAGALARRLARALDADGLGEITLVVDRPAVLEAAALTALAQAWSADPARALTLVNVSWQDAAGATWTTGKVWDAAQARTADLFGPVKAARSDRLGDALDALASQAPWPEAWFRAAAARSRRPEIAALARPLARLPAPPTGTAAPARTPPVTVWPSVTVIVPTRDQLAYLQTCVAGVLERTDYPDLELIVVDNASAQPETQAYLARLDTHDRVRVQLDARPFNFSRLNNGAAAASDREVVVFLNNDIEITDPAWLKTLVAPLEDPSVGASGKVLLYPDGTIQHAGVMVGTRDLVSHIGVGRTPAWLAEGPGTGCFEVTAVTAACMAVRRKLFDAMGGFDPDLAVSYNDVDFGLRLRRRGYRSVCVADAPLVHHESKSRGSDAVGANRQRALAERETLVTRWGARVRDDDAYTRRGVHRLAAPADTPQADCAPGAPDVPPK